MVKPLVEDRDLAGQQIGKYELRRLLGRGAAGSVYLADDTLLGRTVALKILADFPTSDRRSLDRFILEARSAARLDHPNTVRVFETDERDGHHYIAMEWLEGGSAQGAIDETGPLPWKNATDWIIQAARGLEAAHQAGMLHRDIKPGNLLCTAGGTVKIGDFGLVKLLDHSTPMLTALGGPIGTPSFMSPEQCQGDPIDFRSDIYSLGATYYALLVGKPPFTSESSFGVMFAHCANPVPDPRDAIPDIPEKCFRIIQQAMAKAPVERFQTAGEMRNELESLVSGPKEPALTLIQPKDSRSSRRPWILTGAASLLAITLLSAGYFIPWNNTPPADPPAVVKTASAPPAAPVTPTFSKVTSIGNYKEPIVDLSFGKDGKTLACVTRSGQVRIHLLTSQPPTSESLLGDSPKHPGILAMAYASDRHRLYTGGEGEILVWSTDERRSIQSIPHPHQIVRSMTLCSGGNRLATGGDLGVTLWNIESDGKLSSPISLSTTMPMVRSLAAPVQEEWLLAGGDNGQLMLWQTNKSRERNIGQLPDVQYSALAFGKTRFELVVGQTDGTISHDSLSPLLPDGGKLKRLDQKVRTLDCSPDRRLVVATVETHPDVLLINLESRQSTWLSTATTAPARTARFSANGRDVAIGNQSGNVMLAQIPDDLLPPKTPPGDLAMDRARWLMESNVFEVKKFLGPLMKNSDDRRKP